jgi:hypothetical protein
MNDSSVRFMFWRVGVSGTWMVPGSAPQLDFAPNPQAPEFGSHGVVYIRWGKANKGGDATGHDWLEVPEPFSDLLTAHLAARPNFQTAAHRDCPWVFPGNRPGQHLSPPARAGRTTGDRCSGAGRPNRRLAPARERCATRSACRGPGRVPCDGDAARQLGRRRLPRLRSHTDVDTKPSTD